MHALVLRSTVTLLTLLSFAQAGDWPAWRGPSGDGHAPGTSYPLRWSEDSAAWKVTVPGSGHSSPIVSGTSVFLTSSGVQQDDDRCLICIDLVRGTVQWTTVVFESPVEQMHRLNSPASSTPATDGERVYVTFCENGHVGVAAVDLHGTIVWKSRPGTFESRHGFHSCPVVHGNMVLINGEQDGAEAFVAALDARTGETIWIVERPQKIRSFSAPFVVQANGKKQIVLSGADETISYDLQDGTQLWRADGPAQKTVSSIVADDKLLFVCGGRDGLLMAIEPTGQGDVTSTHVRWTATKGVPYVPSPLVSGDFLHVVSDKGIYTAYNRVSGEMTHQSRLSGPTSSSLVGVGDLIYVTGEDGITRVITNDAKATVVAQNRVDEPVFASLAFADDVVLIRSESSLYCFRAGSDSRRAAVTP
jgi:outer membrane protein assembly factor BamB